VSSRTQRGKAGEDAAAAYLESLGFRILRRNLRGPGGEIDIVAREGSTLVFVEVKARQTASFGGAIAAVDWRKRRRIRSLAADFLQFMEDKPKVRFDVLAIDGATMKLHRAAFA
jgi:putative endonuclease